MNNQETIYKKINKIQMELLKKQLKKTGRNTFSKYTYFELEDILPSIMEKANKENIMLTFRFTEKEAELHIVDIITGEKFVNVVPVPEIRALNGGMNIIQSAGAFMTYMKRYLLLNTFGICEKSIIDSDEMAKAEAREARRNRVRPRQNQSQGQRKEGINNV